MNTRPKSASSIPMWVLAVAILGTALVAGGVGAGVGFVVGRATAARAGGDPEPAGAEPSKGRMTREEFRDAVMGKTPEEVTAAVGKPDSTTDRNDGQPMWSYKNRTRDPVSGKVDYIAFVRFRGGVVVSVTY